MEQNTSTAPTVRSTGVRFGLILGVISIAYFVILSVLDVDMTTGIQRWGMSLVTIVIIVLAHKYFKDNGDGFMAFGQGFGIGFWTGLVSSVMSAVFTYFYLKFIDGGMITAILEKAQHDMEEKGQSEEQIEMAMKYVKMFTNPEAMLVMGIIFGILGAMFIALIVSIFTQKRNPQPTF